MDMKTYIVAIDIEICNDIIKHYIEVEASSQDEAYRKAKGCVSQMNVLIEKKPMEAL